MNFLAAPKPKSVPAYYCSALTTCIALVLIIVVSLYKETTLLLVANSSKPTSESVPVNNGTRTSIALLAPWDYKTVGMSLARAFPSWSSINNDPAGWCVLEKEPIKRATATTGLLYVKTPKTGSSTVAGIVRRIAISMANNNNNNNTSECAYRNHHNSPFGYRNRDRNHSFLFTSIRHPSKRAISRVFFTYVTQRNWTTDDASILRAMDSKSWQIGVVSKGAGGHELKYTSLDAIPDWSAWNDTNKTVVLNPLQVRAHVEHVLQAYDYIMVTERMDESIVCLQLLLGVSVGHVLSTSAKVSGGWDVHNNNCVKIQKSFVSPAIKSFLQSDEWHAKNYGDFMLHAAANKSLDLTIEQLGRGRFEKALHEYRKLMKLVDEICAPKLVLPCSSNGTYQKELSAMHCYQHDEGCGYRCIDELLLNRSITDGVSYV